jgi:hypothetical protein
MKPDRVVRRDQLVACAEAVAALATNRTITPQHVSKLEADHEIRKILDAVVRRWSQLEVATFYTTPSLDESGTKRHKDHLVPCRVLVDRMIMNPGECRAVLEDAVVLVELSRAEHLALGGIFADHADLYAEMLAAQVADLFSLGRLRYERVGIAIEPFIF